ncbi:MAG: ATP-binding protein [Deltaproteobacteria bacterium]|nr:ATP-binding protein [Deltaproteobacteria bacterium]
MFEDIIVDQNPHWTGGFYEEGIKRDVLDKLKSYIDLPHIVSIVGVRRGGKSTLLKQLINHLLKDKAISPKNILFLNLETPYFSQYKDKVINLERIYEDYLKLTSPQGRIYCFLDEIQYFNEWQVFVKAHYEQKNIKFIITGSNSKLLSSELITLLSGRTIPLEVYPFSFKEFLRANGLDISDNILLLRKRHKIKSFWDEYLQYGGFPEIAFVGEKGAAREILSTYARNILYQDIAPRFKVKKVGDLDTLFFYLISNIAALYTYNTLSKLFDLSDKTIKEYLRYFSDAYLLFTVDAFSFSVKKQIKSPKKIYTIDTGMASSISFRFSEKVGQLLENMVFLELMRQGQDVFYYQTENRLEVDFICRVGKKTTGLIQVTKEIGEDRVKNREVRALQRAMEETNIKNGLIVTYEDEGEIKEDASIIHIVPAYKFFADIRSWIK